jgi:choline-sulfatase
MSDRPNILWILSDQHNPHIAGYAGDTLVRTQALDRLASNGTRFDAAYCQAPLCVPSRISMLTGKYIHRIPIWNNGTILRDNHKTVAEHFNEHGYTTALVGKMHLSGPRWMGGFQHRPYGDLRVRDFCFHQPDPVKTWDGRWCNHAVGRFPWAGETEIPESLLTDTVVTRE